MAVAATLHAFRSLQTLILLASQSPRRAQLLEQMGVPFRCCPADIDETPQPDEAPADFVKRMAIAKAKAVRASHPGDLALGSDTAVVLEQRILGKPANRADAIDMLLALSGRYHRVLTGVALIGHRSDYVVSTSRVRMRHIEPREAAAYWASGEPADKAGGYAIQGLGALFIEHIEGSYSGIMGLPLFETACLLQQAGVELLTG